MPKDDPELAGALLERLAEEGVELHEQAAIKSVEPNGTGIALTVEEKGGQSRIEGSHLLVAAGRKPRVEALDLDRAGIKIRHAGDHRRSAAAHDGGVYAIGDVIGGARLTHVAGYHASVVIRNALFHLPARVDYAALPWVTYTDPELAQVGAIEAEARHRYGEDIAVTRLPLAENDRAQAERGAGGMLKVVARRNGRILGASILGPHAGELSHVWVLAIEQGLKLKHIAGMFAPYPTWGEANKMAAGEFYKPRLFSPWTRRAVRVLAWLP